MDYGTVKFFDEKKGYGFIKSDDNGKDVFVHSSGLIDKIKQDDRVEYDTEEGKKGIQAIDVKKL